MKRVVGLFDNRAAATRAQQDLVRAGFSQNEIRLVDKAGHEHEKGFWESIKDFFGAEDADIYEEAARRGGTLVIADVPDDRAEMAVQTMERSEPVNVQHRAEEWRKAGWQGRMEGQRRTEGETIPVVEERLRVGKRREEHGGVRVYSEVEEVPVKEDVTLRSERVHVERRPVDRPVHAGDLQERTIEATEFHEEPVVSKEARVIEEVTLAKDVDQRTETVKDTVRRTKVRVEGLEDDFRKDFETSFAGSGYTFDQVRPAYDYGQQLATDERFRDRDWPAIEPEARRAFEQRNPGKWERFRSAIRRGYDETRQRSRAAR